MRAGEDPAYLGRRPRGRPPIIDFVEGKTVIRRLGILGEAAKNLSTKAKEKYPSVAWRDMARPRDLVVHHYWKIGLPEILEIATADVPALLTTFS